MAFFFLLSDAPRKIKMRKSQTTEVNKTENGFQSELQHVVFQDGITIIFYMY
jgi:hypothetical protein